MTPLAQKLGVKEGSALLLVSPPRDLLQTLGSLPPGTELVEETAPLADVVVLFAQSEKDLGSFRSLAAKLQPTGGIWVAWPKKSSHIETTLDFDTVQRTGLDAGLVDNKSCAIDQDWQALRFVVRVKDRKPRTEAR